MGRRLPIWLTRSERKRLLASEMSLRNRAIVSVFLFAGLRSNELRMLNVDDLDFEDMTVLVKYGKRDKERMIPLHAEAAAALDQYLTPPPHAPPLGRRTTGPVFLSRLQGRLSNRWLRALIKQIGQRAGLTKSIHPHALRHTFAVSLRENGVELDVVKDLLGHASIETTEIYTHCSIDQLRTAVDRI